MTFSEEVKALMGQYNDNIKILRDESTTQIFSTDFKNPTWQISPTNIKKLEDAFQEVQISQLEETE